VSIRHRILTTAFGLLYGTLAPLHEIAGLAISGAAWNGRRLSLLDAAPRGVLLEIGCGEGRMLAAARDRGYTAVGVDPSRPMLRRARRRHPLVVLATAQSLPLASASVSSVVASYPGPWIADPATWSEVGRVARQGAPIRVLLGGSTMRGPFAIMRRMTTRLVYGGSLDERSLDRLPVLGTDVVHGRYLIVADRWGDAIEWRGVRSG
jgi:SAM-dependent methyltransferase